MSKGIPLFDRSKFVSSIFFFTIKIAFGNNAVVIVEKSSLKNNLPITVIVISFKYMALAFTSNQSSNSFFGGYNQYIKKHQLLVSD